MVKFQKYGDPNYIQPSAPPKKYLGGKRYANKGFSAPYANGSAGDEKQRDQQEPEEIEDERFKNLDANLVQRIKQEIMESVSPIHWDDIAGLEYAKKMVTEAVVLPLLRPDIFTGLRAPPKGILLFGPPGTGKTLIGRCIATQSKSTFFNISASSLTSKWIGEGEKTVRALFTLAKAYQPSVSIL